jgi:hypothetical protein
MAVGLAFLRAVNTVQADLIASAIVQDSDCDTVEGIDFLKQEGPYGETLSLHFRNNVWLRIHPRLVDTTLLRHAKGLTPPSFFVSSL